MSKSETVTAASASTASERRDGGKLAHHRSKRERELSDLLRRDVDLHTPAKLSPYFRDRIQQGTEPQL